MCRRGRQTAVTAAVQVRVGKTGGDAVDRNPS